MCIDYCVLCLQKLRVLLTDFPEIFSRGPTKWELTNEKKTNGSQRKFEGAPCCLSCQKDHPSSKHIWNLVMKYYWQLPGLHWLLETSEWVQKRVQSTRFEWEQLWSILKSPKFFVLQRIEKSFNLRNCIIFKNKGGAITF